MFDGHCTSRSTIKWKSGDGAIQGRGRPAGHASNNGKELAERKRLTSKRRLEFLPEIILPIFICTFETNEWESMSCGFIL